MNDERTDAHNPPQGAAESNTSERALSRRLFLRSAGGVAVTGVLAEGLLSCSTQLQHCHGNANKGGDDANLALPPLEPQARTLPGCVEYCGGYLLSTPTAVRRRSWG